MEVRRIMSFYCTQSFIHLILAKRFIKSLIHWTSEPMKILFDPLGQPTVTHMSSVRPSVPTFQNLVKQNKVKTMFAPGETVGLAEWIIDDTCIVLL